MKRQKLYVDFDFDFDVLGVVSTFRDYKLAWYINESLHISLSKQDDITIKFVDCELVVSHFKFNTESSDIQLIRNKSYESSGGENQYLIPEMAQIDYFILLNGEMSGYDSNGILKRLKSIKGIDFAVEIDVNKLKSKENFIF